MFILSVFKHLVAQRPCSHSLRGAFAFLGQCVYVLSSCCDIVPLALAISNNKERSKKCMLNVRRSAEAVIFIFWRISRMVKVMFLLEGIKLL